MWIMKQSQDVIVNTSRMESVYAEGSAVYAKFEDNVLCLGQYKGEKSKDVLLEIFEALSMEEVFYYMPR